MFFSFLLINQTVIEEDRNNMCAVPGRIDTTLTLLIRLTGLILHEIEMLFQKDYKCTLKKLSFNNNNKKTYIPAYKNLEHLDFFFFLSCRHLRSCTRVIIVIRLFQTQHFILYLRCDMFCRRKEQCFCKTRIQKKKQGI